MCTQLFEKNKNFGKCIHEFPEKIEDMINILTFIKKNTKKLIIYYQILQKITNFENNCQISEKHENFEKWTVKYFKKLIILKMCWQISLKIKKYDKCTDKFIKKYCYGSEHLQMKLSIDYRIV